MKTENNYGNDRLNLLGINDENNFVEITETNIDNPIENILIRHKIFTPTERGIDILVYSINGLLINYKKESSRFKNQIYKITRLENPIIKKDGSVIKYLMPKVKKTYPHFHPQLLKAYKNKEQIKTLYITEGYFKSFKACMEGLNCVGVASITCLKDDDNKLHEDILKLITTCNVERVVWLLDGDCNTLTNKEIENNQDLTKKPNGFYKTITVFSELLSNLDNVKKYFAFINSENLEGNPKGLDDLLINLKDEEKNNCVQEFNRFDIVEPKGMYTSKYFIRFNITYTTGTVRQFFNLHDVNNFYLYHIERRKDLKGKDFKFYGSIYFYDEKEGKCQIKIPKEAKEYFRVGDQYFQFIDVPDKNGNLNKLYKVRQKSTITDDCGKHIFSHISKYQAFCNVPNNEDYQRVISNCFNLYHPFDWEQEEGEIENTLNYIKHLFGENEINYTKENGETIVIKRYELGLDYLTILYKYPWQILPILCFVSEARQTGKTTFAKWLKFLFGQNMAIVGNHDLSGKFSSHWVTKLIICCDETKIDKQEVIERVKSLSTSGSVINERKGIDAEEVDFFGKFILFSNNTTDFINVDADEIRFWVMNVPILKKINVGLLDTIKAEIPAFLNYLNKRKIITDNEERHWFNSKLLKTEELRVLVENSGSSMQLNVIEAITEMFLKSNYDQIKITLTDFCRDVLKRPNEKKWIKNILYKKGYEISKEIQRSNWPKIYEGYDINNKKPNLHIVNIDSPGTPYIFNRSEFIKYEDETAETKQMIENNIENIIPF